MSENPKPPTPSSEIPSTPPPNPHPPRRSRPRVREVSSRFMSPLTSSSPSLSSSSPILPNPNPRSAPSTPADHLSSHHQVRRSNSVHKPRYADENRPDSINRRKVSPVRGWKPRSVVKLFKEGSRTDTPILVAGGGPRGAARNRGWDSAASKLMQASGILVGGDHRLDDGDCESVKSESCEDTSQDNMGGCLRVSTPMSRSMELPLSTNELVTVKSGGSCGGGDERGGGGLVMRSCSGPVKAARSLNLPPIPPPTGCLKGEGMVDGKKGVRKVSNQQEDVHRLKLMNNYYLQWKFANAKAKAAMNAQKRESERQLYSLAVKISELQDSVKSKRSEVDFLRRTKTLSTVIDTQMPYLDEWSALEEHYSASLLTLTQGLQNISSQLPLVGNIRIDIKEIEEALEWAMNTIEMIFLQVQCFMPKAEQVDHLISDLARVSSGEVARFEECGDLLSKTHLSQVEECSLRGQIMQFHQYSLSHLKEEKT